MISVTVLLEGTVAAQTVFNEIRGEIAATTAFSQGVPLEFLHDPTGKGDVDALRLCSLCDSGTAGNCAAWAEPLLELLNQVFQ